MVAARASAAPRVGSPCGSPVLAPARSPVRGWELAFYQARQDRRLARKDSSLSRRRSRKGGASTGTTTPGSELTTSTLSEGKSEGACSASQLPQEEVMNRVCGKIATLLVEKETEFRPNDCLAGAHPLVSELSIELSLPSCP